MYVDVCICVCTVARDGGDAHKAAQVQTSWFSISPVKNSISTRSSCRNINEVLSSISIYLSVYRYTCILSTPKQISAVFFVGTALELGY